MSLDASPPKPEPRLQEAPRAKRARLRRRRVRENNTEPSSVYRERLVWDDDDDGLQIKTTTLATVNIPSVGGGGRPRVHRLHIITGQIGRIKKMEQKALEAEQERERMLIN